MSEEFAKFLCWDKKNLNDTIFDDVASLDLDSNAIFLAAHTSLEISRVDQNGRESGGKNESDVLESLTNAIGQRNENTVIAVTGQSGTGKSHLVKWINANLPQGKKGIHVIYVPRELRTLRELIGRVLDGLPKSDDVEKVRKKLDKAVVSKKPEQLAEELLDSIRIIIKHELADNKAEQDPEIRMQLLGRTHDTDVSKVVGLPDFMLVKGVRDHLLRKDGAIFKIINSIRDVREGRDSEDPEFQKNDLKTDAKVHHDFGVNSDEYWKWNYIQTDPEWMTPSISILNEALKQAFYRMSGMNEGVNIQSVFESSRRQLKAENKELVLLFEDLAQFGFFDGEIFESLLLQPKTELAAIRAVFAITEGKFQVLPSTLRTRLEHHYRIDSLSSSESYKSKLYEFLSKYLNIARLGKNRIKDSWESSNYADRKSGKWVPNACLNLSDGRECPHKLVCWQAFGEVDDVGLYPYNKTALNRAINAFEGQITPRDLVSSTVKDFLADSWVEINGGSFPSETTRERFDFSVNASKSTVVPVSTDVSEDDRERLYRCRVIWADGVKENSVITQAFSLPEAKSNHVSDHPQPVTKDFPEAPEVDRVKPKADPLKKLYDWENGKPLPEQDVKDFRKSLFSIVCSRVESHFPLLNFQSDKVQILLDDLFGELSFQFRGEGDYGRGSAALISFQIFPDDQGVNMLCGLKWFMDHAHWDAFNEARNYDFSGNVYDAKLYFDEFVEDCTDKVVSSIESTISSCPIEPISATLAIRALALRSLGRLNCDQVGPDIIDEILRYTRESEPTTKRSEGNWAEVSKIALHILDRIDSSWVVDYKSARQGQGAPLAIDAVDLYPALKNILEDPLNYIKSEVIFEGAFSDLNLGTDLISKIDERKDAEQQDLISKLCILQTNFDSPNVGSDLREIVIALNRAKDENLFRPAVEYREKFIIYLPIIEGYYDLDVSSWIESLDEIKSGDVNRILDAQVWSNDLIQIGGLSVFLNKWLDGSNKQADDALRELPGGNIAEFEEKILGHLKDISGALLGIEGKKL
ncbi:ATP-binding protein [Gammaproteobacteria bacterium]|nr:ATP-binding protein [Gammaproteobacteria bacterium]